MESVPHQYKPWKLVTSVDVNRRLALIRIRIHDRGLSPSGTTRIREAATRGGEGTGELHICNACLYCCTFLCETGRPA